MSKHGSNRILESSMSNFKEVEHGRRVGNTTRLIDHIIQLLFKGKIVRMVDHYDSPQSNKRLLDLVMKRLGNEHYIDISLVIVNYSELTVSLSEKILSTNS